MATAPKANATRAKWAEFFAEEYPDVDTDDMGRPDMVSVHKLRTSGSPADSETTGSAGSSGGEIDYRPPTLDDVPEDLRFSTDTGEDREVERMAFAMDGTPFWLYRPSDAALTLYTNQLLSDNPQQRTNAMVMLVQQAVDASGLMYLQERVTDRANNFDDGLYGRVVAAVLNRWGDDTAASKFAQAEKVEAMNRKQRRAAAKAKK
ncbi:tail assembly chaperone [Gordonia phage Twonlo]|uniref:Tail assembly chaperone n=1 Tax=Gordonia phage Tiamoceli TaxID=2510508 RepID=A0A411CSD4_9CAUD|nr:tail assembly chaperone [Gordonia phage Tiamoceli]QAY16773.1 tail assembly chaperone [Gordonia phage Tiamoceli]QOI66772.1 tail assembly chaperone [Gordonia phage Twonlo]QWY80223.1 tail assembly chaperone [Gordonia phage EdmundFerry]